MAPVRGKVVVVPVPQAGPPTIAVRPVGVAGVQEDVRDVV